MTDIDNTQAKERVKFPGLESLAFQHEWDRQATAQLSRIQGLDWIIARMIEYGIERKAYIINIGNNLRVDSRQLPTIYKMLQEACAILNITQEPELYIAEGGVNAYTSGQDRPYIVLLTGLLEVLDEDELMVVIAHELGHIKCQHILYQMMARKISPLLGLIPGAGRYVGPGIEAAFLTWYRRAELSADRAALLVMQDVHPCMTTLMKLAGGTTRWVDEMCVEAFVEQASTYGEATNQGLVDRWFQFLIGSKIDHPFSIERAKLLNEWANSEQYKHILNGDYMSPVPNNEQTIAPRERVRMGLGAIKERAFDATQSFIDKNRQNKPDEQNNPELNQ